MTHEQQLEIVARDAGVDLAHVLARIASALALGYARSRGDHAPRSATLDDEGMLHVSQRQPNGSLLRDYSHSSLTHSHGGANGHTQS